MPNSQESEESEKMDEDSKVIEELRGINEQQRVQISRLEKALKQAMLSQEEIKMSNNSELVKAKETIEELNRKLTSCFSTIDAKNMEVLNLQTALGQYYAEIEAKVNTFSLVTKYEPGEKYTGFKFDGYPFSRNVLEKSCQSQKRKQLDLPSS